MILIYQLGDIPLFNTLVGSDKKGVSFDDAASWRVPQSELTGVSGAVSYLPLTRSLTQAAKYTLSGTLTAVAPYSIQRTFNALKALGGRRNIPLIGFTFESPLNEVVDDAVPLLWLYTNVAVSSIKPDFSYHSQDNPWAFDELPISIDIIGSQRWRVLSRRRWEYRDPYDYIINPNSDLLLPVPEVTQFVHPSKFSELQHNHYFFEWQNELSAYDTEFWGIKYDGIVGGVGSDFTDFGLIEFYSDPILWSAPPSSAYAFTGLAQDGEISITVRRSTGLFHGQYQEEVSTLDLGQLNDDLELAGYSGLLTTDIIYTGIVSPYPGFVMRGGVRITDVTPRWSYSGSYPGETSPAYNIVLVSSVDTSGQVAYLHEFGVL